MNKWKKLRVDDKINKVFSGLTKRLQASLTGFQKWLETLSALQSERCLGTDDNANANDAVDSNAE